MTIQVNQFEKCQPEAVFAEQSSQLTVIHIEPICEDDIAAVTALLNQAYRCIGGDGGWTNEGGIIAGDRISEETLRQEIASKPDASLLLWKMQSKIRGCVWVEPMAESTWYLGSLAIDPLLQNRRYGRKLIAAAEQWCSRRRGKTIRLTVLDVRHTLIKWYERRGYTLTGETEPFLVEDTRFGVPLNPGLRFVYMEKTLIHTK
ncbi:GNAT family N-acetyltransferase [Enterobacter sp. CFBP8995]|nr:GNAT family N-acetyltransferase [Enterobacter sp. CFBP8995]